MDEQTQESPAESNQTEDQKPTSEVDSSAKKGSGSAFYQKKLTEMQAKNDELQQQLEDMQTKTLQEKQSYKELYDLEKAKREKAEEKTQKVVNDYFTGLKHSAIEQEALKLGIRQDAMEDLLLHAKNNDVVQIETTSSGNVNVLGAKEFVEALKEKKTYLFSQNNPPNINSSLPDMNKPKSYTSDEVIALQKKDPAAYKKYVAEKYGLK